MTILSLLSDEKILSLLELRDFKTINLQLARVFTLAFVHSLACSIISADDNDRLGKMMTLIEEGGMSIYKTTKGLQPFISPPNLRYGMQFLPFWI